MENQDDACRQQNCDGDLGIIRRRSVLFMLAPLLTVATPFVPFLGSYLFRFAPLLLLVPVGRTLWLLRRAQEGLRTLVRTTILMVLAGWGGTFLLAWVLLSVLNPSDAEGGLIVNVLLNLIILALMPLVFVAVGIVGIRFGHRCLKRRLDRLAADSPTVPAE